VRRLGAHRQYGGSPRSTGGRLLGAWVGNHLEPTGHLILLDARHRPGKVLIASGRVGVGRSRGVVPPPVRLDGLAGLTEPEIVLLPMEDAPCPGEGGDSCTQRGRGDRVVGRYRRRQRNRGRDDQLEGFGRLVEPPRTDRVVLVPLVTAVRE